jgi:DNA repair exonuclease SbcCD nuclease subunit
MAYNRDMSTINKIASFTDIHFGEHRDDDKHNQLCIEFLEWFVKTAKENDCDSICFLGDWHHTRNKVGVNTLLYSKKGLDILNSAGIPVFFIVGNHDLFYSDSRRIHSVPFASYLENIVVVDEPTVVEDFLFVPWIVNDEDKDFVTSQDVSYVFGHFDLPGFMMNAMVESPERADSLLPDQFSKPEYIFSGHFHKRQAKIIKGIEFHYIGNAFPHNFADEGDTDRGMMILERGKKPEYLNWPDMPVYRKVKLSELSDYEIKEREVIKVTPDVDMDKNDRLDLLEMLTEENPNSEITIEPVRKNVKEEIDVEELKGETVEGIVIKYLKEEAHGDSLDGDKLVDIYIKAE